MKRINDQFGHIHGDHAIMTVAESIQANAKENWISVRFGGDEFVVFMVHASEMQQNLIKAKIEHINKELENPDDGLPPFSISVGIVHGTQVEDETAMFEKCDMALYQSKERGRHTYTFYSA